MSTRSPLNSYRAAILTQNKKVAWDLLRSHPTILSQLKLTQAERKWTEALLESKLSEPTDEKIKSALWKQLDTESQIKLLPLFGSEHKFQEKLEKVLPKVREQKEVLIPEIAKGVNNLEDLQTLIYHTPRDSFPTLEKALHENKEFVTMINKAWKATLSQSAGNFEAAWQKIIKQDQDQKREDLPLTTLVLRSLDEHELQEVQDWMSRDLNKTRCDILAPEYKKCFDDTNQVLKGQDQRTLQTLDHVTQQCPSNDDLTDLVSISAKVSQGSHLFKNPEGQCMVLEDSLKRVLEDQIKYSQIPFRKLVEDQENFALFAEILQLDPTLTLSMVEGVNDSIIKTIDSLEQAKLLGGTFELSPMLVYLVNKRQQPNNLKAIQEDIEKFLQKTRQVLEHVTSLQDDIQKIEIEKATFIESKKGITIPPGFVHERFDQPLDARNGLLNTFRDVIKKGDAQLQSQFLTLFTDYLTHKILQTTVAPVHPASQMEWEPEGETIQVRDKLAKRFCEKSATRHSECLKQVYPKEKIKSRVGDLFEKRKRELAPLGPWMENFLSLKNKLLVCPQNTVNWEKLELSQSLENVLERLPNDWKRLSDGAACLTLTYLVYFVLDQLITKKSGILTESNTFDELEKNLQKEVEDVTQRRDQISEEQVKLTEEIQEVKDSKAPQEQKKLLTLLQKQSANNDILTKTDNRLIQLGTDASIRGVPVHMSPKDMVDILRETRDPLVSEAAYMALLRLGAKLFLNMYTPNKDRPFPLKKFEKFKQNKHLVTKPEWLVLQNLAKEFNALLLHVWPPLETKVEQYRTSPLHSALSDQLAEELKPVCVDLADDPNIGWRRASRISPTLYALLAAPEYQYEKAYPWDFDDEEGWQRAKQQTVYHRVCPTWTNWDAKEGKMITPIPTPPLVGPEGLSGLEGPPEPQQGAVQRTDFPANRGRGGRGGRGRGTLSNRGSGSSLQFNGGRGSILVSGRGGRGRGAALPVPGRGRARGR